MSVRVRIDLDRAAINRLAAPGSPLYPQMVRIGHTVATVARINAPVDTGRLRQSIDVEMISRPPKLTARIVVPVNYALWVHEGHGLILPRRARVLAWQRGGQKHFARRVRPVRGRPFLTDAAREVTGKRVTRDVPGG